MSRRGMVRTALLAAVIGGQAVAAVACDCPQGAQLVKYGAVSQTQSAVPLPPPLPPAKQSSAKAS